MPKSSHASASFTSAPGVTTRAAGSRSTTSSPASATNSAKPLGVVTTISVPVAAPTFLKQWTLPRGRKTAAPAGAVKRASSWMNSNSPATT
jgi:hypothetical protein